MLLCYFGAGLCWFVGAVHLNYKLRGLMEKHGLVSLSPNVESAVRQTTDATVAVHAEVQRLAAETSRAQRFALWVAVGTAILGAVVGGFAGAVAARIVGV